MHILQSTEYNSVFEYNVSSSGNSSRDVPIAHPPHPRRGLPGRGHISTSALETSHTGMDAMRIERRRKGHKRQVIGNSLPSHFFSPPPLNPLYLSLL